MLTIYSTRVEKLLEARGICAMFPANSVGDDIEVYTDESRTEVLKVLHNLRQANREAKVLNAFCQLHCAER